MGTGLNRVRPPGRAAPIALGIALAMLVGCRGAGEYTDSIAPLWWRQNPWGPEAEAARHSGTLPRVPYHPDMAAWEAFARDHLRTGDILFREADARVLGGLFPFSRVAGAIADCRYTHTGILAWERGEPVVYDTSMGGARRQPLGVWVLDNVGHLGIKRPRPEHQHVVPGVIAFCRSVYERQVPFDAKLELGDSHFYCAEMTSRAFEHAGLPLARPIRMGDLPAIGEHRAVFLLARLLASFHPDQRMYAPGNDRFGLWSSPELVPVYVAEDGTRPDPGGLVAWPSAQGFPVGGAGWQSGADFGAAPVPAR
ncbi:C40 family peptidase [Tautonia plasticadhaerens]|uniref:Permuted papain-like amidase enzyme, YaeF/YiiX, C92 family n=1 Tax=Tautonia plasticadhaerens TaxID=2527974 RepID=A0A518GWW0_9BACT|nr:YiiX/YebB-like N1pC/P60 family cysteine hydrolase [Tautonia plasticadhaerens]QDV33079.1 hypothetical protein ElP_09210 [Tautonia plasticadhaerens]